MHNKKFNGVTLVLIAGVVILLGSAFFLFYTNLQQKQQTTGEASGLAMCHNGTPPLPIDPLCVDGRHVRCTDLKECNRTAWETLCRGVATLAVRVSEAGDACKDSISLGCPRPREGYCKEKSGICYECQFEDERGFRAAFCRCTETTPIPTVPVEKPRCEPPYQCLPKEECVPDSIRKISGVNTTVDTTNSCGPNSYCCIKRQPTPSVAMCPPVGTIGKVEVSCPLCETK